MCICAICIRAYVHGDEGFVVNIFADGQAFDRRASFKTSNMESSRSWSGVTFCLRWSWKPLWVKRMAWSKALQPNNDLLAKILCIIQETISCSASNLQAFTVMQGQYIIHARQVSAKYRAHSSDTKTHMESLESLRLCMFLAIPPLWFLQSRVQALFYPETAALSGQRYAFSILVC